MNNVIKEYDKIINELFIFMLAVVVYGVICQSWFFTITFGGATLVIYRITNKKIKEIRKALE